MSQVEVQSVKIDCIVTSRFAHTVMTSVALNQDHTSQEISFEVELPKTAFISNFSMLVGLSSDVQSFLLPVFSMIIWLRLSYPRFLRLIFLSDTMCEHHSILFLCSSQGY